MEPRAANLGTPKTSEWHSLFPLKYFVLLLLL
jgi:hypothetical protein